MVCSELDFFILSGVFAAFPLEPKIRGLNGKKLVEKLEDKINLSKFLTSHFLDRAEGLGQPSVRLRPIRGSLEILIMPIRARERGGKDFPTWVAVN